MKEKPMTVSLKVTVQDDDNKAKSYYCQNIIIKRSEIVMMSKRETQSSNW